MNNPGCDTINGNLQIHGSTVVNLDSLVGLVRITGTLKIDTTSLTSLSGLEGMLTAPSFITIDANHMLLHFNALINMTGLAGISISRNAVLNDVSGLINVSANFLLAVENNSNLSTCCVFKDDVEIGIAVMNIQNNAGPDTGCNSQPAVLTDPTCIPELIPTLGQWNIIILTLLMIILGVVGLLNDRANDKNAIRF